MKGEINFRCKRCGAAVNKKVEDLHAALPRYTDMTLMRQPTHPCDSTHIGVLELLGGTITEGELPDA